MPIEIDKDAERSMIGSLRRYFSENMDEELGDLKASLLLEYIAKEFGPTFYNQGVADAQAFLANHVADADSVCHEVEMGYWKKNG